MLIVQMDTDETDSAVVADLSLSEVLVAYDRFVLPSSLTRKKMSVHLISQQLKTEQFVAATATVVEDEILFKASLMASTSAVPVELRGSRGAVGPSRL